MSVFNQALKNREVGKEVPASMGTAAALESFLNLGDFHDPSATPPYRSVVEIWVNIRTIYRNALNSLESSAQKTIQAEPMVSLMTEDMGILESSVSQLSKGRVKVVPYFCSLDSLAKDFPHARLKEPRTDLQKFQKELEKSTLKGYFESGPENHPKVFDVRIDGARKGGGILTHHPLDLLWHKSFSKLVLLESHTGKIKKHQEWNTKLTGGSKLPRIPFNHLTLQVFGDGNTLFSAFPSKHRKALLALAEDKQWTPLTTMEKVKFSLDRMPEEEIKKDLK